jgi:hypothetical protein
MADKKRSNIETVRKPYRSTAATYEEFKKEIPDDDYYGQKHSEFKRPWLDYDSGYDEMEYRWDFPLNFLDPITLEINVPDGMEPYPFPGGIPWTPEWYQPSWNPNYPMPKPRPNPDIKTKPRSKAEKITWDCDAPSFSFCPGETISLTFEEAYNNPIIGVAGGELDDKSHVPAGSAMGTRTIGFTIPEDYTGSSYTVTATTRNGMTCSTTGVKNSYCDDASICTTTAIGYTSADMATGTSQDLSIINPKPGVSYEYKLAGGGSLIDIGGGGMRYTAPADNANCLNNPTIELRIKGTDIVCATLKIGVTTATPPAGNAYTLFLPGKCTTIYAGYMVGWCNIPTEIYDCEGIKTGTGGVAEDSTCTIPPCTFSWLTLIYSCRDDVCLPAVSKKDTRTASMKANGCCPAALV